MTSLPLLIASVRLPYPCSPNTVRMFLFRSNILNFAEVGKGNSRNSPEAGERSYGDYEIFKREEEMKAY